MLEGNKSLLTMFSTYTQLQPFAAVLVEELSLTKWRMKGQTLHWEYRHRKRQETARFDLGLSWHILQVHRCGRPLGTDWNLPPKHQAQWSTEVWREILVSLAPGGALELTSPRWQLLGSGELLWWAGCPGNCRHTSACHRVLWYSWGVWGAH